MTRQHKSGLDFDADVAATLLLCLKDPTKRDRVLRDAPRCAPPPSAPARLSDVLEAYPSPPLFLLLFARKVLGKGQRSTGKGSNTALLGGDSGGGAPTPTYRLLGSQPLHFQARPAKKQTRRHRPAPRPLSRPLLGCPMRNSSPSPTHPPLRHANSRKRARSRPVKRTRRRRPPPRSTPPAWATRGAARPRVICAKGAGWSRPAPRCASASPARRRTRRPCRMGGGAKRPNMERPRTTKQSRRECSVPSAWLGCLRLSCLQGLQKRSPVRECRMRLKRYAHKVACTFLSLPFPSLLLDPLLSLPSVPCPSLIHASLPYPLPPAPCPSLVHASLPYPHLPASVRILSSYLTLGPESPAHVNSSTSCPAQ